MKTYLDCIPCFFRLALDAAQIAGLKPDDAKQIVDQLGSKLKHYSMKTPPPEMGRVLYQLARKYSGEKDPYLSIKKVSNQRALKLYPLLKEKVARAHDPLLMALKLAIAGNIIDYGVKHGLNLDEELQKILSFESRELHKSEKRFFHYADFKKVLKRAKKILYLADNAGEIVFDRILMEAIRSLDGEKEITCAVKSRPIINDALMEDAKFCGIDQVACVIRSGTDAPGTLLASCSKEFLKVYRSADMIISKGQGNFEALSEVNRPIFFLFMAKCPVTAEHVGCKLRNINLLYHRG